MGLGSTIGGIGGAGLGTYFGGPIGGAIGYQIGSKAGDWLGNQFGGGTQPDPLKQALMASALGTGPSLAAKQAEIAGDQATQRAYALSAGAHGVSPGSALRQAQLGSAQAGQAIAAQAAAARIAEMNAARAQLIGYQGQQFNQNTYTDKRNEDRGLSAAGGFAAQQAWQLAHPGAPGYSSSAQPPGQDSQMPPLASDERVKTGVRAGGSDAEKLLDALHAHDFRYTRGAEQPGGADGEQLGVMAQDLEHGGPGGREMIKNVGGTKMIDPSRAVGAILAALGNIHGRLKAMEGRRG